MCSTRPTSPRSRYARSMHRPRRSRARSVRGARERRQGARVIDRYSLYRLSNPIGPVLDPLYPIRLKGVDDDYL